jgi:hypothetical protein
MEQIDFKKSLLKGRLIYKNKILMILNITSFTLLIAFVELVLFLIVLKQNVFENIFVLSTIIITSFGLSVLKWSYSMRIMNIHTGKSQKDNQQIIKRFVNKKGFTFQYNNKDYIQTIKNNGLLWLRMELNFIIQENEIFININYFDSKVNWPSFFRIKKYIGELIQEANASA